MRSRLQSFRRLFRSESDVMDAAWQGVGVHDAALFFLPIHVQTARRMLVALVGVLLVGCALTVRVRRARFVEARRRWVEEHARLRASPCP